MSPDILTTFVVDGATGMVEFAANWLVQSTLLLAAGLLIGAALRRFGSAVQSAVYRTTLIAVVLAPVAAGLLGGAGVAGWSIRLTELQEHTAGPIPAPNPLAREISAASSAVAGRAPVKEEPVDRPRPAPPGGRAAQGNTRAETASLASASVREPSFPVHGLSLLALLWTALSTVFVVRYARAVLKMRRLCRSATAADAASVELLRELADRFGVRAPPLLRSPLIPGACLTGIRRPVILLPEDMMLLPLREVLLHELAHLRRRDCLWNHISHIALALFFFQPLLWMLSRRMEAAAEEVCDDVVVEFGADPRTYASRLVDVAEQSLAPVSAAGVGVVRIRSLLDQRVRRILDTSRRRSTALRRTVTVGLLGGGVAATLVAGLVGAASPDREYRENEAAMKQDGIQSETLRGVVRNAEGQSLADVPVYLVAHLEQWEADGGRRSTSRPEVVDQVWTDRMGRFKFAVDSDKPDGVALYRFVAVPPGHAVTSGPLLHDLVDALEKSHEVIAAEAHLIEGQILSPDGDPVPGARVHLTWGGLEKFVNGRFSPRGYSLLEFWPAPVATDAEGRFRSRAVGADRVASFVIEAEGFAPSKVDVGTAEAAVAFDARRRGLPENQDEILPTKFVYVLEPSRSIEGRVTNVETGEPIAGASIEMRSARFGPIEWQFTVETNAAGDYRIEAAPAYYYSTLTHAEGYIGHGDGIAGATVDKLMAENGVMRYDIKLTPAVQIRGRVLDETSGRGLADVAVLYHPADGNAFKESNHSFWDRVVLTEHDGTYVIPALPGKGYLLAEVDSEDYVRVNYPMYENQGDTYPHGFVGFDAPEGEAWEAPPILLRRGVEIDLNVTGPNGEDVNKFYVASLEASGTMTHANLESNRAPFRGGQHRMVGLSPEHIYRTFFYAPDLNAGAVVDVKADPRAENPREVALQRSATVRGRLVYEDGRPAENVVVFPGFLVGDDGPGEVDTWGTEVAQLGNVTHPQPPNLRTDANGEFERTGFFPGAYALLTLNQPFADGEKHHRIGVLEAGEVRDLGLLELKRQD